MEWITYLLKVSVCMALFYTCYHFFLQRLTFFSANRIYLLATLFISFSIPALQLEIEKNREVSVVEVFQNSPIVDGATGIAIQPAENTQLLRILQPASDFSWQQMLWYTYLAVALIVIMVFVVQMFMLLRHTKRVDTKFGRLKVVYKPTGFTNCSFLNYVFVDREAFTESEIDILLQHENVHASKYHSADRLLITLAKIVLWFNPFIYLYDKALEQIHEYQADKEAALTIGPSSYAELLLNVSVKNTSNSLVHNFVKNPLKERIKMLFSTQSRNMKKLVYLSCLPLLAILLWSFSVSYVYTEPPFEVATESSKDNLAFQSDTPKYRQKVKWTAELKGLQKEYLNWVKSPEFKKRRAEAYRIGHNVLSGTVKNNPEEKTKYSRPYLFVTDRYTYTLDDYALSHELVTWMMDRGTIQLKVGTAGLNQDDPFLSISPSLIMKNNQVIFKRTEPLPSAFSYEANKVRFTHGEITRLSDQTSGKKEIAIMANGYEFLVKIDKQQVDLKELQDFKKGDKVTLRFVHELKSGAKSYAIKDWVAISKDIKNYGVKNKRLFSVFYEKVPADERLATVGKGLEQIAAN